MLKQRVITAIVLLAILLPVMFARQVAPFAALTLLAVSAGGWEWARLNGLAGAAAWGLGALVALGGGLLWPAATSGQIPPLLWWVALPAWVLGGAWALHRGVAAWPCLPGALRLALGVVMLWLAWAAIVQAKVMGIAYLLSVLCLVWAADIAAYFGGRAFGRRKLALGISPGKSWEGAWSGLAAVLVLALAWHAYDAAAAAAATPGSAHAGSVFWRLGQSLGWSGLALGAAFLTAMSVVGDLFESLVKRAAGAKDSSNLLPGHGGVLDRVDALLPVFPLAMALTALSGGLR
jgi:phosphatidate cytidylyltransferase